MSRTQAEFIVEQCNKLYESHKTQESQEELWNDVEQNYIRWNNQETKLSDLIRNFELRRR